LNESVTDNQGEMSAGQTEENKDFEKPDPMLSEESQQISELV